MSFAIGDLFRQSLDDALIACSSDLPEHASRNGKRLTFLSDWGSAGQRLRFGDVGASERLEHPLQLSRGPMKTLTRVHIFDFDDSGALPAHSIDGMHAEPAAGNEP